MDHNYVTHHLYQDSFDLMFIFIINQGVTFALLSTHSITKFIFSKTAVFEFLVILLIAFSFLKCLICLHLRN